jgi:hypothetical protein
MLLEGWIISWQIIPHRSLEDDFPHVFGTEPTIATLSWCVLVVFGVLGFHYSDLWCFMHNKMRMMLKSHGTRSRQYI